MKLMLVLALFLLDPSTGELKASFKPMKDPVECVTAAININRQIVEEKINNGFALCTLQPKGETT